MEELEHAGKQLRLVLDRYLDVCLNIHGLLGQKATLQNVPQKYLRHINTEVAHFSVYEQKLEQAQASICRVRNRLSHLTPISSLPSEVLTRIFHLVASPCDILVPEVEYSHSDVGSSTNSSEVSDAGSTGSRPSSKTLRLDHFPTHLDRLTHVCSYWRWIAIGTPSLWTHIDLVPNKKLHRGFLARAEAYATRASRLPIELHVADDIPLVYNEPSISHFLSSIRPRVASLDIVMTRTWRQFHLLVLMVLFLDPPPDQAVLTKLATDFSLTNNEFDGSEFIECFDENNNGFRRLTVLHLRGLFPLWDSVAYHNLVDLRLAAQSDERWTCIRESQLRKILDASPGLRILHFALQITDREEDNESMIPVRLNDLEVVSISTDRGDERVILKPGHILRLLAPGLKPLQLSIWHWYCHAPGHGRCEDCSLDQLVKFFQRSNITKFCAKGMCPPLNRLLCHAPNLESLALDHCLNSWYDVACLQRTSPATYRFKSLILQYCSPSRGHLVALLKQHPTNLLMLANCELSRIGAAYPGQYLIEVVSKELEGYPSTRLLVYENHSFNLATSWGPLN